MLTHENYPLEWPVGRPRTPANRRKAPDHYKVDLGTAREHLIRELRLLGAKHVVVSTNLPVRDSGSGFISRSTTGRTKRGDEEIDPGAAVYWSLKGKDHVMASDTWGDLRSNLRALGLAIAALRALERSGVSGVLDQALIGMKALPATIQLQRPWRDVLKYNGPLDADAIRTAYHAAARTCHPDRGGSDAAMSEVNTAYEDAQAELRSP